MSFPMTTRTLLVISHPAARHLRLLAQLPDEIRIVAADDTGGLLHAAPDADAVLCGGTSRNVLSTLWPHLTKLEWVHALAAGLEDLLFPALVESKVVLTNTRGVFARSLGEFALAGMLHFAKDLRRLQRQQAEGRWEPFDIDELHGRVLGIVGYGSIGRAAAERAKAFGMRIHALRRRPGLSAQDPLVDRTYAPAELSGLLAASDYLLCAAPLTEETRGLIGEHQLRQLRPNAVVLNLGRGPVIDEPALIAALDQGRIRGAVLDVFDTEPLPPGHPFYRMENVLLSPHSADHTATWMDDAMQLFVENYRRYIGGEPLLNVSDKLAGY